MILSLHFVASYSAFSRLLFPPLVSEVALCSYLVTSGLQDTNYRDHVLTPGVADHLISAKALFEKVLSSNQTDLEQEIS